MGAYWATGAGLLPPPALLESADQVNAGNENPAEPGTLCYASGKGTYTPASVEATPAATANPVSYAGGVTLIDQIQNTLAAKQGGNTGPK